MNRTLLALALMGISAGAYATPYTGVRIPTGFFFGGTGYYLQPQVSGYDTAYAYTQSPTAVTNATSYMRQVNPNYHGAWGLNASYVFCNLVDISAAYFQYNPGNDSASTRITQNQTITIENPNIDNTIGAVGSTATVTGTVGYRVNQADLTVGESFIRQWTIFHPSVGVRWAAITRWISTSAAFPNGTTPDNSDFSYLFLDASANERSYFSGIGPMVAIDGTYLWRYGFQFVTHADGGLLVGRINTSNSFFTNLSALRVASAQTSSSWAADTVNRMVPFADIRIAGAYTFALDPNCCYNARIEIGYQASHYWNAIDRTFAGTNPQVTGVTANINGAAATSDVGFQGPYGNITINIA